MSSYFQSTFIYGIVLSEEEEKKLYSTIFYDNYYQNIKNERRPDAKKNFLSIEDTGETEGETPMKTVIGLTIAEAYLDDNIKKIPFEELTKTMIKNKPQIVYEIKEFFKEIGVNKIPHLDLYLIAYRYW